MIITDTILHILNTSKEQILSCTESILDLGPNLCDYITTNEWVIN
jgi:hypothetical protein